MAAWDPRKDPVIGPGPAPGSHRTRSGRLITGNGIYMTEAETGGWNKVGGGVDESGKPSAPHPSTGTVGRANPKSLPPQGFRLPGVPHEFKDRASMVKFLAASPGYVKKQRGWLNAHHQDALHEAGFAVGKGGKLGKYVPPKKPVFKPADKAAPATRETTVATGDSGVTDFGSLEVPTVDFSAIDKLNPVTGQLIAPGLANGGAKLFGKGAAEAQAGLQYDSQILKLRNDALKAPLDTEQHVKDIGSWYGQVLSSLKTAAGRDSAIQKAGVDETVDNTAAIASAIGGSANAGSSMVGAAGAEAAGTLQALGTAQDQYNSDLAPILQAEAAAQKTRESAAGSSRLADLNLAIAGAVGERGQAKAAAQLQIDQANNGILDNRANRQLQILQANNQTRQTNFQNKYGVETTKLGAQVSGAKVAGDIAEKLITETAKGKKAGPKPWASTPASQKTYAYKNFTGELAGNIKAYQANPKLLFNFTRNFVNKNGWSLQNPNVMAWVRNAYREAGIQG